MLHAVVNRTYIGDTVSKTCAGIRKEKNKRTTTTIAINESNYKIEIKLGVQWDVQELK